MARQIIFSDYFNIETCKDIDVPKQLIECLVRDGKQKLLLSALYFIFHIATTYDQTHVSGWLHSLVYKPLELATVYRI